MIKKSKRFSTSNNEKSTKLRAPTKPLSNTDREEIKSKLENTMQKICDMMGCKQAKVNVQKKDMRLIVDVDDPFFTQEIKLKKNSRFVDSVEHILVCYISLLHV